jgi:hypothetical protein
MWFFKHQKRANNLQKKLNQKSFVSAHFKPQNHFIDFMKMLSKSWLMNCEFQPCQNLLPRHACDGENLFLIYERRFICFNPYHSLNSPTHSYKALKCIFNSHTHSSCESTQQQRDVWTCGWCKHCRKWQYLNLFIYSSPKSSPFAEA